MRRNLMGKGLESITQDLLVSHSDSKIKDAPFKSLYLYCIPELIEGHFIDPSEERNKRPTTLNIKQTLVIGDALSWVFMSLVIDWCILSGNFWIQDKDFFFCIVYVLNVLLFELQM